MPLWSYEAAKESVLQTDIAGEGWIIAVLKGLPASDYQESENTTDDSKGCFLENL